MLRARVVGEFGAGVIILGALVLAVVSGWRTEIPALWLPLSTLGVGLALSMRSGPRTMAGALARVCAALGAVAVPLAVPFRWLR